MYTIGQKPYAMMRDSDESETVEMIVVAQIPDHEDDDEVLISAINWRLSLTATGTLVPDLADVFVFRLSIPVFSVFQFNLYTRRQSTKDTEGSLHVDLNVHALALLQGASEPDLPPSPDEWMKVEEPVRGKKLHLSRAEWYGHLAVATPDWKTVFISWGDTFSNWMKSPPADGPVQMPLLMIVRCQKDHPKQRLRLRLLKLRSYDEDEDEREDEEEDGGVAREISSSEKEFPIGSGCYWIRGPMDIVRKPSRFPVEVIDQNNRKSVHRQLHVTWSEHPVDESDLNSCVVCCELHPVVGPVPVPRLSTRSTPHSVEDLGMLVQSSMESSSALASRTRLYFDPTQIQGLDV